MITFINILLIALCVFVALLGWSRNVRRRKAHYENILRQPATQAWLEGNLSGREPADIRAAARRFGISRMQAKQLIDRHRNR